MAVGLGFLVLGGLLAVVWRLGGHESFFGRRRETVDPEVAAGRRLGVAVLKRPSDGRDRGRLRRFARCPLGAHRGLIDLARQSGDRLVIAHGVTPAGGVGEEWRAHRAALGQNAKALTEEALSAALDAGVEAEVELVAEQPHAALLRVAEIGKRASSSSGAGARARSRARFARQQAPAPVRARCWSFRPERVLRAHHELHEELVLRREVGAGVDRIGSGGRHCPQASLVVEMSLEGATREAQRPRRPESPQAWQPAMIGRALSTYERIAELPLEIESHRALDGLQLELSPDFDAAYHAGQAPRVGPRGSART